MLYDYTIIYGNSKKGWIRWRKVVSIQLIRTCINNNNDDVSQKWNVLLHLLLPKLHTPCTNYYIVWMTLYLTTILVFLANISLTFIIIQSIFACVYGLLLDAFSETIRSLIHADNRRQMVQCLSHLYHNCVSNHFMVIFYHNGRKKVYLYTPNFLNIYKPYSFQAEEISFEYLCLKT